MDSFESDLRYYFNIGRHTDYRTAIFADLALFFCSWKTPQVCLLRTELQAAQLSRGAQGAMSQLPPVHGAAEQHLHRLVPHETELSTQI